MHIICIFLFVNLLKYVYYICCITYTFEDIILCANILFEYIVVVLV